MLKHRVHKAEAVTGDRKTLHTDELHDSYFLPDIMGGTHGVYGGIMLLML
jgi:hypothetical protein